MRRRPARPEALASNDGGDHANTFEMVDLSSGGAAASAEDGQEEVVPTAPALTAADLAAAALGNLGAVGLQKGQYGWVHFQFTLMRAATDFVSNNKLHSERPGYEIQPKKIDESRGTGVLTVRTSPALYVLLQTRLATDTASLPDYADVDEAPAYRR
ncbi:MAG: hypothetical protein P1U34_06080 [Coxiellaceae bacterium]|nr:hypothetical protein [Coxiellaceae bacterium]